MYTHHLGEQRTSVRQALRAPLNVSTRYYLVSLAWFEKWKIYVEFDKEFGVVTPNEAYHPGEIDNSSLVGDHPLELRKGIVEGEDFVILSEHAYHKLADCFRGGPKFMREAVRIGHDPLFVELYPIRIDYHILDRYSTRDLSTLPAKSWLASKTFDFGSVIKDIVANNKQYGVQSRGWVEVGQSQLQPESSSAGEEEKTPASTEAETLSPADLDCGRRWLTTDITDVVEGWRFVRDGKVLLGDLLAERPFLHVIIEYKSSSLDSDETYPRAALLNRWKEHLHVGDVLDAEDKSFHWYEAIVTKVDSFTGDISLRFRGWGPTFDEVFYKSALRLKIAPLFTRTRNWRASVEEDDQVEYRLVEREPPAPLKRPVFAWIAVTVTDVDRANRTIELKYSSAEAKKTLKTVVDDELQKSSAGPSKAEQVHGQRRSSLDDEEEGFTLAPFAPASQQKYQPINGESKGEKDEAEQEKVEVEEPDTTVVVTVDLRSENICELHTHTKKPGQVSSSNITTRNIYGNNYNSHYNSGYGSSTYSYGGGSYDEWGEKSTVGKPIARGAVGLQNLGNTCFMNSVLQCLSNTYILTEYFTSNRYKGELNFDNPLGHKGMVAQSYAKLMKEMWCNNYSKVVPRHFKKTIGEFQPQFAGYQQQDSQELMGFLLDGLHEDLNRVLKKPAVTKIESFGRPDELIAREAWRRYLLRNDSELVDHFYGQLKSHVTCANCGRESVTFDPFNTISLPVPVKTSRPISVTVQLLPYGTAPVQVDVEAELDDAIVDIKRRVEQKLMEAGRLPLPQQAIQDFCERFPIATPYTLSQLRNGNSASDHQAEVVPDNNKNHDDEDSPTDYFDQDRRPQQTQKRAGGDTDTAPKPFSEADFQRRELAARTDAVPLFFSATSSYSQMESDKWRISKELADNTPMGDFARYHDRVTFFQLLHPVTPKPTYQTSYYNNRETPQDHFLTYLDLYFGFKKKDMYSRNWQPYPDGYPQRINITKETTMTQLFQIVDAIIGRYTTRNESAMEEEEIQSTQQDQHRCYSLFLTTSYCQTLRVWEFPEDWDTPLNLSPTDVVFVDWKDPSRNNSQVFDYVAYHEVKTLGSSAGDDDGEREMSSISVEDRNADDTSLGDDDKRKMQLLGTHGDLDHGHGTPKKPRKKGGLDIYRCLDKFVEREQLAESETTYCPRCKHHLAPVKKMDIWSAPDVLVLHLKRFQFMPGSYFIHREKISDLVDFPVYGLDLRSYVRGPQSAEAPPIYDLYAVSLHSGGLGGGHYTAVCKNPLNEQWYNFNDSFVSNASASGAVSEMSYVLFYRRAQGSVRWAGMIPLEVGLTDEEEQN